MNKFNVFLIGKERPIIMSYSDESGINTTKDFIDKINEKLNINYDNEGLMICDSLELAISITRIEVIRKCEEF